MNSHVNRSSQILVIVLLIPLAFGGCGKKEGTSSGRNYHFTLSDLQGNSVRFSDFQGQVIMVNFWAPWCGPCRMETPDLIDLYGDYKDAGLRIVGVAVGFRGEQSVYDFVSQFGVSYPVVLGNSDVAKSYGGFRGIPATFLFNRDGELYKRYIGMRPREVFEKDILELL